MAAATLAGTGADTRTAFAQPVAELVDRAGGGAAVCLMCSGPGSAVAARSAATRIAADGTPVLLGGGGWYGWQEPPALELVGSMAELAVRAGARTDAASV